MIESILENLTEYLAKNNAIEQKEKDVIKYGIEITLANLVNLFIVFSIGLALHMELEACCFYGMFVSLRFYCGGYHADQYMVCFALFALTCLICLILSGILAQIITLQIIAFPLVLSGAVWRIWRRAPIEHKNRPLNKHERKEFKKRSFQVLIVWVLVGTVLSSIRLYFLAPIAICTIAAVSLLMFETRR